jgi:hypothetical protein
MGLMSDPGLDALAPPDGPAAVAALKKANGRTYVDYVDSIAGKKTVGRVRFGPGVKDTHLLMLRNLTELWCVDFHSCFDCRVTDTGLRGLRRNKKLVLLDLSRTGVTDRGLEELRHLPALKHLWLAGTGVTDKGVPILARYPSLLQINLRFTKVTGKGLLGLKNSKSIDSVKYGPPASVPADVTAELRKGPNRIYVTD